MHVAITNHGPVGVPFFFVQDQAFATMIGPGDVYTLNNPRVAAACVGDSPTFAVDPADGLQEFAESLADLQVFWRNHNLRVGYRGRPFVQVDVVNEGTRPVRVLLGLEAEEVTVPSGGSFGAAAVEYIELREVGG